jgi:hypothetical protein
MNHRLHTVTHVILPYEEIGNNLTQDLRQNSSKHPVVVSSNRKIE